MMESAAQVFLDWIITKSRLLVVHCILEGAQFLILQRMFCIRLKIYPQWLICLFKPRELNLQYFTGLKVKQSKIWGGGQSSQSIEIIIGNQSIKLAADCGP